MHSFLAVAVRNLQTPGSVACINWKCCYLHVELSTCQSWVFFLGTE